MESSPEYIVDDSEPEMEDDDVVVLNEDEVDSDIEFGGFFR